MIFKKDYKLQFKVWINYRHLYKLKCKICIWLCEQQLHWRHCKSEIYYELCIYVEWRCYSMNVEETMYNIDIYNRS